MRKRIRSPLNLSVAVVGALLLVAVGYLGGRALGAGTIWAEGKPVDGPAKIAPGEEITPPPDDVMPEPGSTPDTSKPFWHVPYQNAERLAPKVRGDLNGITVGADSGPLPGCGYGEKSIGQDAIAATKGTYFDLGLERLPADVKVVVESAELARCTDGSPRWFRVDLDVRGRYPGESNVNIERTRGVTWWVDEGTEDRWSTGTVAGRNAVFLDQIIPGSLGDASVIVLDPEIAGSTRVKSFSGSTPLSFILEIAEVLYR